MTIRTSASPVAPARVARILLVAALVLLPAVSVAAGTRASAAGGPTAADRTDAAHLKTRFPAAGLGSGRVGKVLDVASGRTVWSSASTLGRMPASTEKLATTLAALTVLGPAHTEHTRTRYQAGTLYLVGGGDQLLTAGGLKSLAAATAKALKQHGLKVTTVRVDDSLFPAPTTANTPPGWLRGYYPGEVAPVRALALSGARVTDTALAAGHLFAQQLAAAGAHVPTGTPKRKTAPASAVDLASHTSASLSQEIEHMLKVSDNNAAEGLLRLTALARNKPADWQGGTAVVRSVLAGYGVPLSGVRIYDGSGLSRSDRMTASALASIAALSVDARYAKQLWPLYVGLPVAGRDGTLSAAMHRFSTKPSICAAGKVHAKTGSLHDANALVGVTKGKDGHWKAFAFVENGVVPATTARRGLDGLAATVTGCW